MQKDAEIWKKEFEGWYGGMKILHYFLGFPPYRTGGLTKYAFDLAKSQVTDGNEVLALWPGEIKSYSAQPYIKEGKRIEGIRNLELINPLPVSLDEGINQFEAFTKPCDVGIYVSFLEIEKPDVIHIHTLMGMHKEFIEATNQSKIRTVYTSHDYFGLCPKVTLYKYGECCDDDHCCRDCIQCNANSLSLKKIQILQSHIYRWAKDTSIVKMLRKKHRGEFFAEKEVLNMPGVDIEETSAAYRKLRAYYVWMYEHIDFIHFNSTVSESVFKRYLTPKDSKVVSITHKGILDNRDNPHVNSDKLRIVYLAPAKPFKGFYVLKQALDEFWDEGHRNFELQVFSSVVDSSPYMNINEEGFKQSELKDIFSNADMLVAPSVWYETFGFTVLEAISNGVPVIVSDNVGSKDIIGDAGIVVKANNIDELTNAIRYLLEEDNRFCLKEHISELNLVSWRNFVDINYQLYIEENR